jgi:RNA polymerase sigma factor (sigma-70 family)
MKSLLKAADVSLTVVSSAHADLDARTDVAAIRADHSCCRAGEEPSRPAMPGREAASMTAATVAEQRFANQLEMLIPRLTRYARALTRDTDRANDLVQDVAVRAIEKQHLWQPETDLRAWLFRMMHNEFVDETRRNSRAERYAREWKLGYVEATKGRQIARLELRDMERALGELSEEKRQAVL